jgi:hypothetical protein
MNSRQTACHLYTRPIWDLARKTHVNRQGGQLSSRHYIFPLSFLEPSPQGTSHFKFSGQRSDGDWCFWVGDHRQLPAWPHEQQSQAHQQRA